MEYLIYIILKERTQYYIIWEPGECPAYYIAATVPCGSMFYILRVEVHVKMGFTKLELVQFFDRLTELVSEENKEKARVQIREFFLDFEKATNMEM